MSVLENIDRLILAQAVWELGSNSWSAVAKLLSKHPLLFRPKSFFTAQSCHAMYDHLMKEAGLERNDANFAPHTPSNLKLAQRHYQARVNELRELIAAEETKFKTVVKEIDEIRSGLWDEKIKVRVTGEPIQESIVSEVPETAIPEATPTDEVFGSDLSGVTDSGSLHSLSRVDSTNNKHQTEMTEHDFDSRQPSLKPEGLEADARVADPQDDTLAESPKGSSARSPMTADELAIPNEEEVGPASIEGNAGELLTNPAPPKDSSFESIELKVISDSVLATRGSAKSPGQQEPEQEKGQEQEVQEPELVSEQEREQQEIQELGPLETDLEVAKDAVEDEGITSGEEPLHITRRSTRRHRSSVSPVAPVPTRGARTRRQRRLSQEDESSSVAIEAEADRSVADADEQLKAETPKLDDDQAPLETGSPRRRESKRKASFAEGIDSPRDKKRARDESEPAEEDESGSGAGPGRRRRERPPHSEGQVALKRFQYVIGMLHSQISQHRNGNIFHHPIKNSEAPDYHEIVKRPIDLKTIKARIKDGAIGNSLEYQRDIYLMFANAMMYNRPGSDIYTMAEDMMLESEGYIHTFRQTEGFMRGAHR